MKIENRCSRFLAIQGLFPSCDSFLHVLIWGFTLSFSGFRMWGHCSSWGCFKMVGQVAWGLRRKFVLSVSESETCVPLDQPAMLFFTVYVQCPLTNLLTNCQSFLIVPWSMSIWRGGVYTYVSIPAVCGLEMEIGVSLLTIGSTQSTWGRGEAARRGLLSY